MNERRKNIRPYIWATIVTGAELAFGTIHYSKKVVVVSVKFYGSSLSC